MSRILIVEDDPDQARALGRAFTQLRPHLGFRTARNGLDAIAAIRDGGIDLVLTDLQMPEMDGFELVAWLLSHCPDMPVFTMSAFGCEETAQRLHGLGGIECFPKPMDAELALTRLTEALDQSVRGHVKNVSLASFLQLLEMERKTCTLGIQSEAQSGVLLVRRGALIDAHTADIHGEAAAIAIVGWASPSIAISRHTEHSSCAIDKPLGYILMEAMRVHDENARNSPTPPNPFASVVPAPRAAATLNGAASERETWHHGGTRALALVDSETGSVLHAASLEGCPVAELARMAAQVLRKQAQTLTLCTESEGIEELVFCTSSRCDVIRPLGPDGKLFALLVFAPDETNLVMARLELERFVLEHSSLQALAPRGSKR